MARMRRRSTKALRELAHERFLACEYCNASNVTEFADDLLERLRLRTKERRRLERALSCPNCDSPIEPLDGVVSYSPNELRDIRRHQRWREWYGRQFPKFHEFLEMYPGLGGLHPLGHELARGVARVRPTVLRRRVWYRACRWCDGEAAGPERMLPPDPHLVQIPSSRFNYAGQVGVYVADWPIGAAIEVLDDPTQPGRVWMAAIEFQRELRILDLGIWVCRRS